MSKTTAAAPSAWACCSTVASVSRDQGQRPNSADRSASERSSTSTISNRGSGALAPRRCRCIRSKVAAAMPCERTEPKHWNAAHAISNAASAA